VLIYLLHLTVVKLTDSPSTYLKVLFLNGIKYASAAVRLRLAGLYWGPATDGWHRRSPTRVTSLPSILFRHLLPQVHNKGSYGERSDSYSLRLCGTSSNRMLLFLLKNCDTHPCTSAGNCGSARCTPTLTSTPQYLSLPAFERDVDCTDAIIKCCLKSYSMLNP